MIRTPSMPIRNLMRPSKEMDADLAEIVRRFRLHQEDVQGQFRELERAIPGDRKEEFEFRSLGDGVEVRIPHQMLEVPNRFDVVSPKGAGYPYETRPDLADTEFIYLAVNAKEGVRFKIRCYREEPIESIDNSGSTKLKTSLGSEDDALDDQGFDVDSSFESIMGGATNNKDKKKKKDKKGKSKPWQKAEERQNKGIAEGYPDLDANALVPTNQLGTGTADATKFLRGDQTWDVPASGTGDVVGPASAVDGHLALFDGTTGKLIKDGGAPASGDVTGPGSATNNAIAFFNGTTGKIIKDLGAIPSSTPAADTIPISDGSGTLDAWVTPTEAFPVGAVFISVVSTNPATLLGYGTWSAIATGRTLVGIDTGDTDFDTVEETGGAKTVASAGTVGAIAATATAGVRIGTGAANAAAQTHTHAAPTFTGSATSVVQPYFVVYMWKRTA